MGIESWPLHKAEKYCECLSSFVTRRQAMKMCRIRWPMDRNPLCIKEMYPLLIVGVMFWFCKDKSFCLFSPPLMRAGTVTLSLSHAHSNKSNRDQVQQSRLPKSTLSQIHMTDAWCHCWHANLLSALVAFLKAAMNKGESAAFPSPFSVICSFFKLILSHAFFFSSSLSPFPWESDSFGHSSNFQHIQRTRVYPQKPNTLLWLK